jgi:hypothetical protein
MSLAIVTVVKDDFQGLLRTQYSLSDQLIKVNWWVVTPKDDSSTYFLAQDLVERGIILKLIIDDGNGLYSAMNKAISVAPPNSWLWFLNAGDEFASRNSCEIVERAISMSSSRWIYGGHFLGSSTYQILGEFKSPPIFKASKQLFAKDYISHQSTIFEAGFLQELGGFNVNYRIAADWELMIRASLLEPPTRVKDSLSIFYMGGLSTKSRQISNFELLKVRSTYLHPKFLLKSYIWFTYRLFRNFVVQVAELMFPDSTNALRKIRLSSRSIRRVRDGE